MWMYVLLGLVGLITWAYFWVTRKFNTFTSKGIPQMTPSFPFGSPYVFKFFRGQTSSVEFLDQAYTDFPNAKVVGQFLFGEPQVVVNDLDLVKNVLIKDFDHFVDRRGMSMVGDSKVNRIFSKMLTNLKGEQWKAMRTVVSPVFTSGKLKTMTALLNKVGDDFVEHMKQYIVSGEEFNAKETYTNFTLDSIGTCGFGLEVETLKHPNNLFRQMVRQLTGMDRANQMLKFLLITICPWITKLIRIDFFDAQATEFFLDIIERTMNDRRKNKIRRNDLIDLLLDAAKQDSADIPSEVETDLYDQDAAVHVTRRASIPDEDIEIFILSNAFLLFFAGFDTTSSQMAIITYFLAKHQDVQERLAAEIQEAVRDNNGREQLDYNTIQTLPYLDQVVHEATRMYPLTILARLCVKDYKIPGVNFTIPAGMLVEIPSPNIMKDPKYFPNPHEFNPENFSPEAKAQRTPYAYLAFGQGPRNCVGMRFALLQLKLSLVRLLSHYKVETSARTPTQLKPDPRSSSLQPLGGVWVQATARS